MNGSCARICFGIVLLTVTSGCGGVDQPKLNPVRGKVTLDGQPLANAIVSFIPDKGPPSGAITNSEGKYEMRFKSGGQGAVTGVHAVTISTDMDGNGSPGAEKVPQQYNKTSMLSAEVKNGPNEHNFELQSQ
jgi:hypothetical protein